ncbi:MAG TPA: hypothetical protein PLV68_14460, partial [Ilumatobacteraceae bacterium]|nr:hypothetical protein [Ilumatobacteraceae bacterium]
METWAWCGVRPDEPDALAKVTAMARDAGIDATFGPCRGWFPGYSAAFPGDRYVDAATYMQLVRLNASVGMQTVVYDARVWDADPAVRAAAKQFWRPVYEHIAAWDVGDEYFPESDEWQLLIERMQIVLDDVTLDSGVYPYTNHISDAVELALEEVPDQTRLLSFDLYTGDKGVSVARAVADRVERLMCAVNTYQHLIFVPTPASVRADTAALRDAGCDMILVFGGDEVRQQDPSVTFGPESIIDARTAEVTPLGTAMLEAAGHSSYRPVNPARLADTRGGYSTVDGAFNGIGRRNSATTTELAIAGRAGVGADAASAALTITAVDGAVAGFLTVYPCTDERPNAAQVNYGAGTVVATTMLVGLSENGSVCIYTSADVDLVVDVAGSFPAAAEAFVATAPARLVDTRVDPTLATVDGQYLGIGVRGAGSVSQITVANRADVPWGVSSAALTVTVVGAATAGFVTVFPCGQARPETASVNFAPGSVTT